MNNRELYECYAKTVERFFANKAGSTADISDLMHTTFVRFFERVRDAPAAISSPKKFLFGVARNVLLEHWRMRGRANNVDDFGELSIADLSNAPEPSSNAEKTMLVRELLRELPFNHQLVLELHYWEQLSYQEIADLLEIPFGTASTWGYQGRLALDERLNELLGSPEMRTSRDGTTARVLPTKNEVRSYGWYDKHTGAIDVIRLAIDSMVGARPKPKASDFEGPPAWLVGLGLPTTMPNALPNELSEIARAAWKAWHAAGRPGPAGRALKP